MPEMNMRARILKELRADPPQVDELLAYNSRDFDQGVKASQLNLPLPDEPFVQAWQSYSEQAQQGQGAWPVLRQKLVQLNFPISKGISQTDFYRAATLQGASIADMPQATGLELSHPQGLAIEVYQGPGGGVPMIIAADHQDFVALAQALSEKNEPTLLPQAQGALAVAGYNNWDRLNRLRRKWEAEDPLRLLSGGWAQEFERIKPRKELYQDRFILLSHGPYSNVTAAELGLEPAEWDELSLRIRREHEYTHYFTRRVLGSMANNILDELIADYQGLLAALGRFPADWFLRFLGLESFPRFRPSGRLVIYRGSPPLSDGAFAVLQALIVRAAHNLARFQDQRPAGRIDPLDQALVVLALSTLTLEQLAAERGEDLIASRLAQIKAG